MIGIIDYGMGNLGSVMNACRFLELDAKIVTRPEEMDTCEGLVLPGVGAFGDCMQHLDEHGFTPAVQAWIDKDRHFLGICLGLQVLFEGSEESPGVSGLGLFPGIVKKFELPDTFKVPQIGWNNVAQTPGKNPLFEGVADNSYFYFVHSYYVDCEDPSVIAGETDYGRVYTSAVARGRLSAVQFHPEKSQKDGLQLLKNFGRQVKEGVTV